MTAEHTAVGVHLVDHDVLEVLEELRPLGVMRQDRLVQHVGVADDDVATRAHRLARIAGRIAIEGIRAHAEIARLVQRQQLGDLILRQRLGRKKIQRLALAVGYRLQHRQVVAQRLARGGRCHHHEMPPLLGMRPGLGLM